MYIISQYIYIYIYLFIHPIFLFPQKYQLRYGLALLDARKSMDPAPPTAPPPGVPVPPGRDSHDNHVRTGRTVLETGDFKRGMAELELNSDIQKTFDIGPYGSS